MTKFYILRPIKPWQPWYDCCFGMVIEALNASDARKLAVKNAGGEGKGVWLDPDKTSCHELKISGVPQLIIRDFHAA